MGVNNSSNSVFKSFFYLWNPRKLKTIRKKIQRKSKISKKNENIRKNQKNQKIFEQNQKIQKNLRNPKKSKKSENNRKT